MCESWRFVLVSFTSASGRVRIVGDDRWLGGVTGLTILARLLFLTHFLLPVSWEIDVASQAQAENSTSRPFLLCHSLEIGVAAATEGR